jgi:hypothetical protein
VLDVAASLSHLQQQQQQQLGQQAQWAPAGLMFGSQPAAAAASTAATTATKEGRADAGVGKRRRVSDATADDASATANAGSARAAANAAAAVAAAAMASDLSQAELLRRAFSSGGGGAAATDEIAGFAAEKDAENAAIQKEAAALDAAAAAATRSKYSRMPAAPGAGSRPGSSGSGGAEAGASGWGFWAGEGAGTPAEQAAREEAARLARRRGGGGSRAPPAAPQSSLAAALAHPQSSSSARGSTGPRAAGTGVALPRAFVGTRRDATLSTVLLSERVDAKLGSYQAATAPRPFASVAQYEKAMRQPIGQEWNTLGAARDLTAPEWTTRAGLIIQPIRPGKQKLQQEAGHESSEGPAGPALASVHRSAVAIAGKGSNKKRAR